MRFQNGAWGVAGSASDMSLSSARGGRAQRMCARRGRLPPAKCYASMIAMMSFIFKMRWSSLSIFICVPAYLSYIMRSPFLTVIFSSSVPGPTATTTAVCVFSCAASGMMMPDAVFDSAFSFLTRTLSANGLIFIMNTSFVITYS